MSLPYLAGAQSILVYYGASLVPGHASHHRLPVQNVVAAPVRHCARAGNSQWALHAVHDSLVGCVHGK